LIRGNLVAFPTETVYGLGADAINKDAVEKIYQTKARPLNHPLIVHIATLSNLIKWARNIPDDAFKIANTFWPGPLTLILSRTSLAKNFVTGGQEKIGIRVPSHPVALALLKEFEKQGGLGIAAPSANRFGAVSPTTAGDVKLELGEYLRNSDVILDGGKCLVGIESTIIDFTQKKPMILRPGKISKELINEILGFPIEVISSKNETKVSGLLDSHYSPKAKVFLSGLPMPGDGYIALAKNQTPTGVIRLSSPDNNEEYAQMLYSAFRLADSKKINNIFAIPAEGDGIADAINDRLRKAAFTKIN
jgi:L-threonylcarbamoyladenylate synthase